MSNFREAIDRALREERWEDYEEIWLDALENNAGTLGEFLRAARIACEARQGHRVGSVLSLMAPQVDTMRIEKKREFCEAFMKQSPRSSDFSL